MSMNKSFLKNKRMMDEVFGPSTLLVSYETPDDLLRIADSLEGQLTASLFGEEEGLRLKRNPQAQMVMVDIQSQMTGMNY